MTLLIVVFFILSCSPNYDRGEDLNVVVLSGYDPETILAYNDDGLFVGPPQKNRTYQETISQHGSQKAYSGRDGCSDYGGFAWLTKVESTQATCGGYRFEIFETSADGLSYKANLWVLNPEFAESAYGLPFAVIQVRDGLLVSWLFTKTDGETYGFRLEK